MIFRMSRECFHTLERVSTSHMHTCLMHGSILYVFNFQFTYFCFYRLQDGTRGHLDGLASVYCELLMAPFGEVLMVLEDARQRAWLERSPKHISGINKGHRGNSSQTGTLPNSHSQPIYVPGKYSVSSNIDVSVQFITMNYKFSFSLS
jgi:hypothetical protein